MKPFNLTLAANETRSVSVAGDFFELRKAPYVLDLVEFLNRDNGVVGLIDESEASDKTRTKEPFAQVRITNGATAQAIRFYHGFGDAGSNRFTGVVSGEVSLSAATLAAIDAAQIAAMRPLAATGSFSSSAALVANVAQQIFAPAANVNGVIVLSVDAYDYLASASPIVVLAKAGAAPASQVDGEIIAMSDATTATANIFNSIRMDTPKRIAPGLGLYFFANQAGSGPRGARWFAL
ncbi:MAG: hypothetical protein Q8K71_13875 [Polaromonas sp.]|nr:hypothetical protein [Polaromonas sp.]